MKRIVWLVLIVLVESCYGYVPLRYRPYYSPYAGGLVPYDVYYSPYAFSYKNPSGLISAHSFSYWSWWSYQKPPQPEKSFEEMRRDYEEWLQLRQARIGRLKQEGAVEESGKDVIYQYLKAKGVEFWIRNGLSVRNKTLSCEFLLKGGNLIKFWDPETIVETVTQKPEYAKIYQRYSDNWMVFSKEYQGKIYEIKSSRTSEIIQTLNKCNWIN